MLYLTFNFFYSMVYFDAYIILNKRKSKTEYIIYCCCCFSFRPSLV